MKPTLATIALCISFSYFSPARAEESAPTLSIVDATKSAQVLLDQQKLPKDYFIRSITLAASPDKPEIKQYEARFEPTKTRRVMVGSEPEPIKYQVIVVSMDGTASIQEREFAPTRRIVAKPVGSSDNGTNK